MAEKTEVKTEQTGRKRRLRGLVVSTKMQKTIVVKVDRHVKHSRYAKYLLRSKKYLAHDETSQAKQGDMVEIIESRPLSKSKRWALREVLKRSTLAEAAGESV
ncbi:MAG: 30S ribosomal protein S17 [Bacteriovoracia bacterium]